jgi:hypothetical protein
VGLPCAVEGLQRLKIGLSGRPSDSR